MSAARPSHRPAVLRGRDGQAVVIIVFMIVVLFAGVGLAVDADMAYYNNAAAERAASAAALSGVVFTPFALDSTTAVPAGSRNDATDRAWDEASKNGFTNGVDATVTVSQVPLDPVLKPLGPFYSNRLKVKVLRNVPTFFMRVFGIQAFDVSATSTAGYLPPISLGQPGQVLGSTVSQLGSGGFYFMRTEGWRTDRGQGDAFTPDPNSVGCGPACPSDDIHHLSGVIDNADASLPSRGGYNFRIVVPPGSSAHIQVYNASFQVLRELEAHSLVLFGRQLPPARGRLLQLQLR